MTKITVGSGLTSIGANAFENCDSLFVVNNNSELEFTAGDSSYGGIAENALVVDNNGEETIADGYYTIDDYLY